MKYRSAGYSRVEIRDAQKDGELSVQTSRDFPLIELREMPDVTPKSQSLKSKSNKPQDVFPDTYVTLGNPPSYSTLVHYKDQLSEDLSRPSLTVTNVSELHYIPWSE
jgi:hypothetical protein